MPGAPFTASTDMNLKMHSFRIGGATALMAAGVDPALIKNKGRWASDIYEIYCRVCKGKMLELSHLMSTADTNQWLSKNDGFFDQKAGFSRGEMDDADVSSGEESSDESDDDDDDWGSDGD